MYELRVFDQQTWPEVVTLNTYDIVGQDETMFQAIARLNVSSGNSEWKVSIVDHNTVRFVAKDEYHIVYVPEIAE